MGHPKNYSLLIHTKDYISQPVSQKESSQLLEYFRGIWNQSWPMYHSQLLDLMTISGPSTEEHLNYLDEVLDVCGKNGLRLKLSKCVFLVEEVDFLGYKVNEEGVTVIDDKIKPILNAPQPENTTQLKSFLGMLMYYHRHLPNLAHTLEPLHRLLRKNSIWKWTDEQSQAFNKAKKLLVSPKLLVHYDTHKPLTLACDASPYGLGAVLSHVMEDGSEKPYTYTVETLML